MPRQLLQRIPKGIKKDSAEYRFYVDSFSAYKPVRKNLYLNRKVKLPTEEDIYVCDCISSESLINPRSPRYRSFVEAEEEKLFAKWRKKQRRKKTKAARRPAKPGPAKIAEESPGPGAEGGGEPPVLFPQPKPPQVEFVYSKMKAQVSPEFQAYLTRRVQEMVKNDSNISIDCGPRCLNRLICTECEVKSCPVGALCRNRRFQKQQNKLVYPKPTPTKGWGLFALEPIRKGDFIIQYLGEIFSLSSQVGLKRRFEYAGSTCTYLMKLSPKEVIDPTKKGNVARFINHSCDPNCVTQKWNVMGEVFVGIFAKKEIRVHEELSFDYKFDVYKTPFLECFCEAFNCKGYLGLAGGNPKLRLRLPPPRQLSPVKITLERLPAPGPRDLIELRSDKKSKKKSSFIIKKSPAAPPPPEARAETPGRPEPEQRAPEPPEEAPREEAQDRAPQEAAPAEPAAPEPAPPADETEAPALSEKDECEICNKSIYCDSESEAAGQPSAEARAGSEGVPCTQCPANYHIGCLASRVCAKCGHDLAAEGENQIGLVAGDLLRRAPAGGGGAEAASPRTKEPSSKSIDSDNLDWASQSRLELSARKTRRGSGDTRPRKNSEGGVLGFAGAKADFRTKKKQQFKMITGHIKAIFDKDFPASAFRKAYFDEKNKLRPLGAAGAEPCADFSSFFISPVELAVFKQRGTRIFLKQTNIHVFWNNSDISYKNFFARNSELRCGCRPEERRFVADLLRFIQRCVVAYRESSGSVESSFRIPAIFLKRVLGEYYRNSKFVEKEFGVKLGFERAHVTDECYPIHFLTAVRLRGRSQNIQRAHQYIQAQLRPLVARRKYMTREDIKAIISKLQQIKRNINPTEIRCCRDNALRDINHPFYTIYYKDKEVAFIGTKERVAWAEKFVASVIEASRRLEDSPLALNFLVPGGAKAQLLHVKGKAEKKFPGNRLIVYDSLPPKRTGSLTLISTYRRFEDFARWTDQVRAPRAGRLGREPAALPRLPDGAALPKGEGLLQEPGQLLAHAQLFVRQNVGLAFARLRRRRGPLPLALPAPARARPARPRVPVLPALRQQPGQGRRGPPRNGPHQLGHLQNPLHHAQKGARPLRAPLHFQGRPRAAHQARQAGRAARRAPRRPRAAPRTHPRARGAPPPARHAPRPGPPRPSGQRRHARGEEWGAVRGAPAQVRNAADDQARAGRRAASGAAGGTPGVPDPRGHDERHAPGAPTAAAVSALSGGLRKVCPAGPGEVRAQGARAEGALRAEEGGGAGHEKDDSAAAARTEEFPERSVAVAFVVVDFVFAGEPRGLAPQK